MDTHVQQKIMKDIQHLDSFQLSEVLDFVDFLNRKDRAVSPEPDIIDSLCGKYKEHLATSSEFARRKQEEIKKEESKWHKR
ncbi:MAG: hypothetical protein AABY54_01465 [Deltaproteobacteria bacterium]